MKCTSNYKLFQFYLYGKEYKTCNEIYTRMYVYTYHGCVLYVVHGLEVGDYCVFMMLLYGHVPLHLKKLIKAGCNRDSLSALQSKWLYKFCAMVSVQNSSLAFFFCNLHPPLYESHKKASTFRKLWTLLCSSKVLRYLYVHLPYCYLTARCIYNAGIL